MSHPHPPGQEATDRLTPLPGEENFPTTWVIVPAFNEAAKITSVLEGLRVTFNNVVVVDDGSSDGTEGVARDARASVLRHRVNLGQGAALQTGFEFALQQGAEIVATFDADGQHRVEDLQRLVEKLGSSTYDVVLGSRFLAGASSVPRARRLLLRGAVVFTRATTGLRLTDAHNGLRAFSREAAAAIEIKSNRMAHASELLDQIARLRLNYCELPVTVRYTEYSLQKGQRSTAAFRVLLDYLLARVFD